MVAHAPRDANAAGIGKRFEPGGDVDAVAEDVAILDHDVADIDADAEEQAVLGRQAFVRDADLLLHLHGAIERIDHALEFGQDAVAGGAGDAAAMGGDQIVDDQAVAGQGRKGRGLVLLHMPTITLDIGGEDGDQPAFQSWRFHVRSYSQLFI